jgi:uncharacterized pyridoxamine 5'-phosphate oxidase family protein
MIYFTIYNDEPYVQFSNNKNLKTNFLEENPDLKDLKSNDDFISYSLYSLSKLLNSENNYD